MIALLAKFISLAAVIFSEKPQMSRGARALALRTMRKPTRIFLVLFLLPNIHAATQTFRLENISGVDTYVRSSLPNQAWGSELNIRVGGWGDDYRTLVKFSTASLPANTSDAKLYLYCYDHSTGSGGSNVAQTIHTVTSAWDANVTYSNQPAVGTGTALPAPGIGQWVEFNITPAVISWLAGTPNYGVEIRPINPFNQWNEYRSLEYSDPAFRPYLIITSPVTNPETRTIRLENIGASDACVDSDMPTAALGIKPELRVGGQGNRYRSLLQLPTAGFPPGVTGAKLHLYCKGSDHSATGNASMELYAPAGSWTNSVTWLSQPDASFASATTPVAAKGAWISIDITTMLNQWLTGGPNNGIELRSTSAAGQTNVFASIESAIPEERPYLTLDIDGSYQLTMYDDFSGSALNPAMWSSPGSATLSGGVATVRDEIKTLRSFQVHEKTIIEFRMRRVDSPHVWAGIADSLEHPNIPGIGSIDVGENPFVGGMALAVHGIFGEDLIHNNTSTTDWREYRLTLSGTQATLSRGLTLSGLTESLTKTLGWSTSLRSVTFGLNPYGTAQIDWVRVYDPYRIYGRFLATGATPSGEVRIFSGAASATWQIGVNSEMDVFFGKQRLTAFYDRNGNGLREPWEKHLRYLDQRLLTEQYNGLMDNTLVDPPDSDGDGMTDEWETANGLNSSVNDAGDDVDNDGLTNLQEYLRQTQIWLADSDDDGMTDLDEVLSGTDPLAFNADADADSDGDGIRDLLERDMDGTDPLSADTDGDGMDDGWEIANGLDPLVNDAREDRDLDGLTNKEEYDLRAAGYKANVANSLVGSAGDDHQSDYRRLHGEGWVRRRYDRNDRLISTERDNGLAQIYTYDANSEKVRDLLLTSLDGDGDGLPDAWEHANNLAYAGPNAGFGVDGPLGDPDGDGFTNLAEWEANTDPHDALSHPGTGAVFAGNSLAAAAGFTPTNWVMATGQLDGYGSDEVVVGVDGAVGASENTFSVLSRSPAGWTMAPVVAGNAGITSLAIGKSPFGGNPAIFAGTRPAGGAGGISEYGADGTSWTKAANPVFTGTGTSVAQVIGVAAQGVISLGSPASMAVDSIYRTGFSNNAWESPILLDGTAGKRDWPAMSGGTVARWLGSGGIQLLGISKPLTNVGAVQRPGSANWYFLTPTTMTWDTAEAYAVQNGGHLATIDDATENAWLRDQFGTFNPWIGLFRDPGSDILAGWKWISGSSKNYRNWLSGQPDFAGGTERYAQVAANGGWNDLPISAMIKGIVELSGADWGTQVIPDPAATAKLVWRGRSLAIGAIRSSGNSLVAAFIDDKDSSATANSGDDFVVAEYDLSAATPLQRTLVRIPQTAPNAAGTYGITTLHNSGPAKPGVLAVGEPDGTVSLWSAADPISPMVRKVFSTEFKGKAWHQLEPIKEANDRESLVGLLVDPASPGQCQVIYWPSEVLQAALDDAAPVLNHAPIARVLTSPASGGGFSQVSVRTWDAEAHSSAIALQFQTSGETDWTSAHLLFVDGLSGNVGGWGSTVALRTAPGGINHSLVWNAAMDLGDTFIGSVFLRSRATDSEAGAWSEPILYTVDVTRDLDIDGDGFTNAREAAFGTDINSAASLPALATVRNPDGSLQLSWPAAAGHSYRLETSSDLTHWTTLESGLTAGIWVLPAASMTDVKRFYRIAAE